MKDLLTLIKNSFPKINLFGAVLAKSAASGIDISEYLFTQVASRFDMFLGRMYRNTGTRERGIAWNSKLSVCHSFASSASPHKDKIK